MKSELFSFFRQSKGKTTKLISRPQTSKHLFRLLNRLKLLCSLFLPLSHSLVMSSIEWIWENHVLALSVDGLNWLTIVFSLINFCMFIQTYRSVYALLQNLSRIFKGVFQLCCHETIRLRVRHLCCNSDWRLWFLKLGFNQSWWLKVFQFSFHNLSNRRRLKLCFHIYVSL